MCLGCVLIRRTRVCEGGCQQGGDGGLWERGKGGWMSAVSATPVLLAAHSVCGLVAWVIGARAVGTMLATDLAQRGKWCCRVLRLVTVRCVFEFSVHVSDCV